MNKSLSTTKPQQSRHLSTEEIAQLEQEGQLLRVLQTDLKKHVQQVLTTSPNKTHPFVAVSGEQVYISFATLQDERQRKRVYELIRRCQLGSDVDLRSLPIALRQLIQPTCVHPQRFLHSLLLAVAIGVAIGILAMAISVLVSSVAELTLKVALDDFRITVASFVIFAVLGWMGAAIYFWRRMQA